MTTEQQRKNLIKRGAAAGWSFHAAGIGNDMAWAYYFRKDGKHLAVYFDGSGAIMSAWGPGFGEPIHYPTCDTLATWLEKN